MKPFVAPLIAARAAFFTGLLAFVCAGHFAITASSAEPRPKVLILGDSISMGYTPEVRALLLDTAEVLRPAENCQHTAHGLNRIKAWLGTNKWDVIHFNWGIWDTHMLDAKGQLVRNESAAPETLHIRHTSEQYRTNLVKLVEALAATGAKLIWASTTPILSRSGKRFDDIKTLNTVAADVMRARRIAINDLYEFTLPHVAEWQSGDKVHFNATGNKELGKRVVENIRAALKERGAPKP